MHAGVYVAGTYGRSVPDALQNLSCCHSVTNCLTVKVLIFSLTRATFTHAIHPGRFLGVCLGRGVGNSDAERVLRGAEGAVVPSLRRSSEAPIFSHGALKEAAWTAERLRDVQYGWQRRL